MAYSDFDTTIAAALGTIHSSIMGAEQTYTMPEYPTALAINGILTWGPQVSREREGAAAKFEVLLSEFAATRNPEPGDTINANSLTYRVTDIEWGQYADAVLWLRVQKRT
jgi:hypothetical protein